MYRMPIGKGKTAAFSLIELMVTVSIIGMLSAMAVPRFSRLTARAKQSEAKNNLSMIYTLQEAYYVDNNRYWDGTGWWTAAKGPLDPIGFAPGDNSRYDYGTAGNAVTLLIRARAITNDSIRPGCGKRDWWDMRENRAIIEINNCATLP